MSENGMDQLRRFLIRFICQNETKSPYWELMYVFSGIILLNFYNKWVETLFYSCL
jgi:hypothetical protein